MRESERDRDREGQRERERSLLIDLFFFSPDMPMREAAELLSDNAITGAPVVVDGKLVGVLTQFDFLYLEMKADAPQLDMGKYALFRERETDR